MPLNEKHIINLTGSLKEGSLSLDLKTLGIDLSVGTWELTFHNIFIRNQNIETFLLGLVSNITGPNAVEMLGRETIAEKNYWITNNERAKHWSSPVIAPGPMLEVCFHDLNAASDQQPINYHENMKPQTKIIANTEAYLVGSLERVD